MTVLRTTHFYVACDHRGCDRRGPIAATTTRARKEARAQGWHSDPGLCLCPVHYLQVKAKR